jgi:glycosyltransferase involved in cell wall biosynthesis
LRVVRVIDRLNVGGPTKHVAWLGAGLDWGAFRTVLVTGTIASGEGDMAHFARAAGIEPIVISGLGRAIRLGDVTVVVRLFRLFLRLRPDIVHTHKAKAGAVGRAAAFLYRWLTPSAFLLRPRPCRVVHTFHGHIFHSYYGRLTTALFLAIERVLARFCTDRIITISERQRDDIVRRFRVARAEKVEVIPIGIEVETSETAAAFRRELAMKDDLPLVGIVGRLCEVKNHALILRSAAQLAAEGVPFRVVVVGDGHLRPEIEACINALGLAGNVSIVGFRDDVTRLYPDFDVVALTSLNEGTPATLLEAMACGRACLATEVGGVADIMGTRHGTQNGFTLWDHGLTVPSGDASAFAGGLRFLLERPGLRRTMGECGRAFVRAHMSKERLVRDIEALYHDLTGWAAEKGRLEDEGSHYGWRRLHRLASGGALHRAWRRGLRARRPVDGFDREHPGPEGPSAVHLSHR